MIGIPKEYELIEPPKDGISSLYFNKNTINNIKDVFIVSSWDGTLRLYDINGNNHLIHKIDTNHAILDTCFGDNNKIYFSGLNKKVQEYDIISDKILKIGLHNDPIRSIKYSTSTGLVITGGWDSYIRIWDPKIKKSLINEISTPGKVYAMDNQKNLILIGTSDKSICLFDLRSMKHPLEIRSNLVKYQIRAIKFLPEELGVGCAIGTIEGRVAFEYFNVASSAIIYENYANTDIINRNKKSYAFKCHRENENGETYIYPVNTITFHPIYHTFATGGCDGMVNIWDGENKKRINQLKRYSTSISALDFNKDGTKLAIAASYTFEQGEKDHPDDAIYIRNIDVSDVRPKNMKSQV